MKKGSKKDAENELKSKDETQSAEQKLNEEQSDAKTQKADDKTKEAQELTPEEQNAAQNESDKAAEYLDKLQRLMAEFDNYRKRSQKEKTDAYDYAVSNTVAELLPIIDNFERALKLESADKAFYDGVTMIYKQLLGFLEHIDVTPIEAKDQVFDPNLHNAILHIEDENYGESVIVEELQKGYLYKEKVIRHSMVKVAN